MADDPVTLSVIRRYTSAPGQRTVIYLVTGSIDYNATVGAGCDLSAEFDKIDGVSNCGTTGLADGDVTFEYTNTDYDDASGGFVVHHWGGGAGAALDEVSDGTNLGAYQWRVTVTGTQVGA